MQFMAHGMILKIVEAIKSNITLTVVNAYCIYITKSWGYQKAANKSCVILMFSILIFYYYNSK